MIVKVHRKVKVYKMSGREFRKHRIKEIANLVGGLTLSQLDSVCRYVRLLRSTTTRVH